MKIAFFLFVMVAVVACAPSPTPTAIPANPTPTQASPTAVPLLTATPTKVLTTKAATGQSASVAFVKDGNILVWEEATGQSRTIFDSGDVIGLTMSDDGQVVAFLRRSVVKKSDLDWYEQSALWAVGRNGKDPRELVSAEELRGLLSASETDSTNIPQMAWIPRSHQLLYCGWTYYVVAEGESHATPAGLYLVDADTGVNTQMLPATDNLRFAPAPDGQHIALMSLTGLSFLAMDGSHRSPEVLTYPRVGLEAAFPSGVWTQDSSAFLIAGRIEAAPDPNSDMGIWRALPDGTPAQRLATFSQSQSDSITFSPDGRYAAFFRGDSIGMVTYYGWFVTPLAPEAGPLAIPGSSSMFWQNLHWSPAGAPYAVNEGMLFQLCPDAAQDAETCGEGLDLGDKLAEIHWIDGTRFLFVTREPYDLYFGKLDGTKIRLAEGVERFAAVAMTCQNDSEFMAGGEGPATMSVAPDTLFRQTWRIRNTGTCEWDPSYRLAFLSGERLSGPRSLSLGKTIPPGGEIELSVKFITPAEVGTYQGEWQLFAPDGRPFGVQPTVDVVVPSHTVMEFTPDQVVAQIPAESGRIALGEGALWVLSGNTVSRVDLDTNQNVATMTVGDFPQALTTGYGAVWVTSLDITRIDPVTNTISTTIPVVPSSELNGIAAGAGSVWVSSGSEGTVSRVDPDTNQVIATIRVELWPSQIATTEDAVWVTNPINPVLTRIDPDTNEVSAEINLDCTTRGLAADATAVWVACDSAPTLYRIDPLTNQIVARIAVGNHSRGVAISSHGVWVTSLADNTLTLIDPGTNQISAVYQVGQGPVDVVAVQDELFVMSEGAIWRIHP